MECGLDGGPGVSDCSWGVVRVGEQEFNELLSMKTKSSGGLKDEWDQVDAGISVEFFPFLTFGHATLSMALQRVDVPLNPHRVHPYEVGDGRVGT